MTDRQDVEARLDRSESNFKHYKTSRITREYTVVDEIVNDALRVVTEFRAAVAREKELIRVNENLIESLKSADKSTDAWEEAAVRNNNKLQIAIKALKVSQAANAHHMNSAGSNCKACAEAWDVVREALKKIRGEE